MSTVDQPTSADAVPAASGSEARWRLCAWVFLGLVLAVRLATFLDYGVTWDEPTERRNGTLTARWYASGLRDASFLDERDQYLYGSFYNVIARPVCRRSPLGYYETQHLLLTLIGFATTLAVYLAGARIGGPLAGLLAALCLTLTPSFYGHSFNNPKDVPFAALYALVVMLLVRGAGAPLSARRVVLLGVAIGLAAGVRMVGLALVALAALPAIVGWWRTRAAARPRAVAASRVALTLLALGALAWGVMLIWWPYVQMAPLSHTWEVLRGAGDFKWFSRTTLFDGRHYRPGALPWTYVPTWLAISLPELYLLALAGGAALALTRWRRVCAVAEQRALGLGVVLLAALAPLTAAMLVRPVMYDGLRHLLFVLPPLAIVAGVALERLLRCTGGVLRSLILAAALGSMALTALDMVRLHPYQYVYFNRLVAGGLRGADGRYETDYWGASYKEAVSWLERAYRPEARGIRVANCSEPFLSEYELDKAPEANRRFVPVTSLESADVVLATTRWACHRAHPGRVVHVVARQGVGLCYVIERDLRPQ